MLCGDLRLAWLSSRACLHVHVYVSGERLLTRLMRLFSGEMLWLMNIVVITVGVLCPGGK